jgi:hypothetical protein
LCVRARRSHVGNVKLAAFHSLSVCRRGPMRVLHVRQSYRLVNLRCVSNPCRGRMSQSVASLCTMRVGFRIGKQRAHRGDRVQCVWIELGPTAPCLELTREPSTQDARST